MSPKSKKKTASTKPLEMSFGPIRREPWTARHALRMARILKNLIQKHGQKGVEEGVSYTKVTETKDAVGYEVKATSPRKEKAHKCYLNLEVNYKAGTLVAIAHSCYDYPLERFIDIANRRFSSSSRFK